MQVEQTLYQGFNNMLLFTVFLLAWTSFNEVYSVMPVDLDFYAEDGNWIIKATLTGKDSANQIKIDEYIQSVNGTITGKIVAKIGTNIPATVYYKSSNRYERLFVRDAKCIHFIYRENGWNYFISELDYDNFATHLLLVGPSILFRINKSNLVWKFGADEIIRGVKHHSATTALDQRLNVWFYYKGNSLEGFKRPTRILFYGYDPNHRSREELEQYWFDYYIVSKVEQNFDTIVTPEPGLVCDKNFKETDPSALKPLPKINQHRLHFIAKTKSFKAGPDGKEEVYADERFQILRLKISTLGKDKNVVTTDFLYDFQLGIAYKFAEDGKCTISPMDSSVRGIVRDSSLSYGDYKLDLSKLLKLDSTFRYLGPALFEDSNEIGIKAWERYDKSFRFGSNNFPNVITTHYIRETERNNYTLVGTTFKAHDNSINIKLTASLTKSYFDFDHEISPSDSMEKFSVKDCYPSPKDKKTIAFYFICPDSRCDKFNQNYHQIQDKLEEALVNTRTISASRISSIVPIIDSQEIVIYVTILNFPNIKDAFKMQEMKLSNKMLSTTTRVIIDGDEEACLRTYAVKYEPFIAIAFCKTDDGNLCQKIDGSKVKLVKDENGTSCSVFMTPLKNLYRYNQESPLTDVHMKLNNIIDKIEITLGSSDSNNAFKLKPYQVKDVTKPVDEYHYYSLFENIIPNTKLSDDKLDTVQIVGTIDLSSCHRKCVQSVENDCRSFSFCTYPDRTECFLSTIGNFSSDKMLKNSACGTYFIQNLGKFKKISSKKFINIESVPFESSLGKCASFCSNTDSCKSFQYCSGSCSLARYYTDASSAYSESCDIYIPNVLNKFELTGKLVVENVFHTELNLNAEQCAALCHDWKDNDAICQSFNFCSEHGRTSSLCHLSKYSTRDGKEKLVHSDSCQNYGRIKQSADEPQNTHIITKSLSTGSFWTFWIVSLFVAAGLISGIVISVAYSKLFTTKSRAAEIYDRNTFSWTKQLNDDRQSVAPSEALQMSSDYAIPASE